MRPSELDALIEQGVDAMRAAKGLSAHEQAIVEKAIAKMEAAIADAPAEEPPAPETAPEPEPEVTPEAEAKPEKPKKVSRKR